MKTLVVTEEGQLKVKEIDRPQITERQALIKTVSCGICGTDATIIRQAFKGLGGPIIRLS